METFLTDLYRPRLTGEGLDMIRVDGSCGLLLALPTVLHGIPLQRRWVHKISNVLVRSTRPTNPRSSAHSIRS
jgi:hypothetical protein